MPEMEVSLEQPMNFEVPSITEPFILEDIVIETLAIDGICGVY